MQETILKNGRQYRSHPVYEENLIFFFISVPIRRHKFSYTFIHLCGVLHNYHYAFIVLYVHQMHYGPV